MKQYRCLLILLCGFTFFINGPQSFAADAPTPPSNIRILDQSDSFVEFAWNPSSGDSSKLMYGVFRNNYFIGLTRALSFVDRNVRKGDAYEYSVKATDWEKISKKVAFVVQVGSYDVLPPSNSGSDGDSIAPSTPQNLRVISKSDNHSEIAWNASTGIQDYLLYAVFRNDYFIGLTRSLSYRDTQVRKGDVYRYSVKATNWNLVSQKNEISVAIGSTGGGTNPPPPIEPPNQGSGGAPNGWSLRFSDDFSGSGNLDTWSPNKKWRFETMERGLHRAGNMGMTANGNFGVPADTSAEGKRWSAWYNKYENENAYLSNGKLILGGTLTNEWDPTRPIDYYRDGQKVQFQNNKLYTSWVDTWSQRWVGPGDQQETDPNSPNRTFKYGYFETQVDFSEVKTPGFRVSFWLMPSSTDPEGKNLIAKQAYDGNANNGLEVDIFEYEWNPGENQNHLIVAIHGYGATGEGANINMSDYNINLLQGTHTVGFLWTANEMVWSVDGKVIWEVRDPNKIPDVYSYVILSREMNSGVTSNQQGSPSQGGPFIPADPGLYLENTWLQRNTIPSDRAKFDYIKVWQP